MEYPDPGWHCQASENDLRTGGKFKHRMEAKDGSFGFDFEGIYDQVTLHKEIAYTMPDGRKVSTLLPSKMARPTFEPFSTLKPKTTRNFRSRDGKLFSTTL